MAAKRAKKKSVIVLATDGSEASGIALRRAITAAKATDARLHIVNVLTVPVMPAAGPEGLAWMNVLPELRSQSESIVEEAAAQAAKAGVGVAKKVLEGHDPASAIVQEAERVDAALVVVGSHGRTGIRRMLLGSVAERVVRFAHCPVLVVR